MFCRPAWVQIKRAHALPFVASVICLQDPKFIGSINLVYYCTPKIRFGARATDSLIFLKNLKLDFKISEKFQKYKCM
jgi:hypothetical protein